MLLYVILRFSLNKLSQICKASLMKEVSDFNVKEIETLSIPSKTVLLEEGKIADKIYLVRKGCLRLFFIMKERI